jgi:hypothetical protein
VSRKTILCAYLSVSKQSFQVYPAAPTAPRESEETHSRVSRRYTLRENETLTMSVGQNSSQFSQTWEITPLRPLKRKAGQESPDLQNRPSPPSLGCVSLSVDSTFCSCLRNWKDAQLIDKTFLFSQSSPRQSLSSYFLLSNWSFLRLNLHPSIPQLQSPSCLWKILALPPSMLPVTSPSPQIPFSEIQYLPCELIFTQYDEERDVLFKIRARLENEAMSHFFGNIPPSLVYLSLLTFHFDGSPSNHADREDCDYASLVYRVLQAFLSISRPTNNIEDPPTNPCFDLLFQGLGEVDGDPSTISLDLCDLRDHRRVDSGGQFGQYP